MTGSKKRRYATVTRHSISRGKQRLGSTDYQLRKNTQRAKALGLRYDQTFGKLRTALQSRMTPRTTEVVYYANAVYVFGRGDVLLTVLDKDFQYDKELYKYVNYPTYIKYKNDRYRYKQDRSSLKDEIAVGTEYYKSKIAEILKDTGAVVKTIKAHPNNLNIAYIDSDPVPYELIQEIRNRIGVEVAYGNEPVDLKVKQSDIIHELKYQVWSWFGGKGVLVKIPTSGITNNSLTIRVKRDALEEAEKLKPEFEKVFDRELHITLKASEISGKSS